MESFVIPCIDKEETWTADKRMRVVPQGSTKNRPRRARGLPRRGDI